jgi:hypothetical protein
MIMKSEIAAAKIGRRMKKSMRVFLKGDGQRKEDPGPVRVLLLHADR